ncbi:uncharacterized protein [Amphiura filiformis]|uniref:uncharacterized protein n=1 Tax=Amphiura filiformis TaxID=82378 RepID=UPI003B215DC6
MVEGGYSRGAEALQQQTRDLESCIRQTVQEETEAAVRRLQIKLTPDANNPVAGSRSCSTPLMSAYVRGENVSVIEQQTIVKEDQQIQTGGNYQAQTMVIQVGRETDQDTSAVLGLEMIRKQLMEEYRETRGKLPLLPGMPEEFARMEDIFVDLEIIEEDKKPSGAICKKLNSYVDLVCIERNEENSEGIEEIELVKRILVKGNPGAGKSTTISKLAYDWACNKQDSPMSKFDLVFVITVNEIDTDTDLIGVIREQLLSKVSRQSLEELIQSMLVRWLFCLMDTTRPPSILIVVKILEMCYVANGWLERV